MNQDVAVTVNTFFFLRVSLLLFSICVPREYAFVVRHYYCCCLGYGSRLQSCGPKTRARQQCNARGTHAKRRTRYVMNHGVGADCNIGWGGVTLFLQWAYQATRTNSATTTDTRRERGRNNSRLDDGSMYKYRKFRGTQSMYIPVKRLLQERLLDLLVEVAHIDSVADHTHIPHGCSRCSLLRS